MNTAALKSFAQAARRDLLEAVGRKLDIVLAAEHPDYRTTHAPQVAALRALAAADRAGLVERVAYTWFNRLAALRYLDARGWHPFRARVLTGVGDETQPELLKLTRQHALPDELRRHADPARLDALLDGALPSADPQGEVYRALVLAACRYYHALLPDLFERLDDATELLLPDDLLTERAVAQRFRTAVSDADCAEVEVLGWLYQFYISEKKDAVMARKAAVPAADIPAVTQLFTPHWIVRYLVENSLGRLWLLNRPGSRLRERMPYYVEAEAEADYLRVAGPEELRVLDPAVGSGHMLTYAFDLLYAIYEEEGYAPSEIAGLILRHNLYGVDIDPRAAQLAQLALVLKARERARGFFRAGAFVAPHVIALQDVRFEAGELREYVRALELGPLFDEPVLRLLGQFEEATTFGSLIRPALGAREIEELRRAVELPAVVESLLLSATHRKVLTVLDQAELLALRCHVVVANPPYMGSKYFNADLKPYIAEQYEQGKADIYAAFILRNLETALHGGMVGMITIPNWLALTSFEQVRRELISRAHVVTLVNNGRGIWGSDFGSCAFVLRNASAGTRVGVYYRLSDRSGSVASLEELEQRFLAGHPYRVRIDSFTQVPGTVFAFWISEPERAAFAHSRSVGGFAAVRQGLATADDSRFLRLWHEISMARAHLCADSAGDALRSEKRWFPFNKGGAFRRWYGNNEYVINWERDGAAVKAFRPRAVVRNEDVYFRPGITWSRISIANPSFRKFGSGFIIGDTGPGVYPHVSPDALLAFLNSRVATNCLSVLSPSTHFEVGQIRDLPLLEMGEQQTEISRELVEEYRRDWDDSETSWDFSAHPLAASGINTGSLAEVWEHRKQTVERACDRVKALEIRNNELHVQAYGLAGVLGTQVGDDEVVLTRADRARDAATLLSYAVGCMMGRYSLDAPGLVLADAGDTLQQYAAKVGKQLHDLTFAPDADGIVPVLDGEWFEDDVVARTRDFLRATFGEATLRENVRWLEESLGKDLRRYFLADFYRDHLQAYKKRPIYWMVQSPKRGFAALVYLHRYTRDTLNVVLNRYLREYQAKLRGRIDALARAQVDPAANARDRTAARKEHDKLVRTLRECDDWERDTLLPLAQARIPLDLDDGVKVNYQKLGGALAPIPGLAAAADE